MLNDDLNLDDVDRRLSLMIMLSSNLSKNNVVVNQNNVVVNQEKELEKPISKAIDSTITGPRVTNFNKNAVCFTDFNLKQEDFPLIYLRVNRAIFSI